MLETCNDCSPCAVSSCACVPRGDPDLIAGAAEHAAGRKTLFGDALARDWSEPRRADEVSRRPCEPALHLLHWRVQRWRLENDRRRAHLEADRCRPTNLFTRV